MCLGLYISLSCLINSGLHTDCKLSSLARCSLTSCSTTHMIRTCTVLVSSPDRMTQVFYIKGQGNSLDLDDFQRRRRYLEEWKIAEVCTTKSGNFESEYKHGFVASFWSSFWLSRCLHKTAAVNKTSGRLTDSERAAGHHVETSREFKVGADVYGYTAEWFLLSPHKTA